MRVNYDDVYQSLERYDLNINVLMSRTFEKETEQKAWGFWTFEILSVKFEAVSESCDCCFFDMDVLFFVHHAYEYSF